jgi:hypothetical protein
MKKIWIVIIVVAALLALWVVTMYIGLATDEDKVRQAMAQIESAEGVATSADVESYNRLVDEYNLSLEKFPGNVFAKMFGFYRLENKPVQSAI